MGRRQDAQGVGIGEHREGREQSAESLEMLGGGKTARWLYAGLQPRS